MKLSLIESRLFGRICYGFKRDKYGFVEIVPEQAEVVKTIFRMYREENSLEDIKKIPIKPFHFLSVRKDKMEQRCSQQTSQ